MNNNLNTSHAALLKATGALLMLVGVAANATAALVTEPVPNPFAPPAPAPLPTQTPLTQEINTLEMNARLQEIERRELELKKLQQEVEEGLEILQSSYVKENTFHRDQLGRFQEGSLSQEQYEKNTSHIIR